MGVIDEIIAGIEQPKNVESNASTQSEVAAPAPVAPVESEVVKPLDVEPTQATNINDAVANINDPRESQMGAFERMHATLARNPETDKERKARERKERSLKNISAFSEAVGHVANIWGTMEGGAPMKLESNAITMQDRIDKYNDIRRRTQDQYTQGRMTSKKIDEDYKVREREMGERMQVQKDALSYREQQNKETRADRERGYKLQEQSQQRLKEDAEFRRNETIRMNDHNIEMSRTNAGLAQQRINNSYRGGPDVDPYKGMTPIALSSGEILAVPDALSDSVYSGAYNMIAGMGDALPEEVKVTIDPYNGVPDIKTQRNIVNTYMHLFPDVENAVMERVQELNTNYFGPKPKTSPTSSGSPHQPKIPGVPGGGGSPASTTKTTTTTWNPKQPSSRWGSNMIK